MNIVVYPCTFANYVYSYSSRKSKFSKQDNIYDNVLRKTPPSDIKPSVEMGTRLTYMLGVENEAYEQIDTEQRNPTETDASSYI